MIIKCPIAIAKVRHIWLPREMPVQNMAQQPSSDFQVDLRAQELRPVQISLCVGRADVLRAVFGID